jgi:uncharacterized membrane protein YagU involved in acid resistance
MDDLIFGGSIAGLIGGTVGIIFSHSMFIAGVTPTSSLHLAAALVLHDVMNLGTADIIISLLTHLATAAAFGVALALILRYTGKDHYLFKGAGFGVVICLIMHAYLIPILRRDLPITTVASESFVMITTHAIIGIIAAIILVRYTKLRTDTY